MNDIPLKCLLGLSDCTDVNPLQVVGVYVRWFEMLSLAGIVFAISQFIENNRLRTYILKRKKIIWPFYGLIFFSILAVILATLLSVPLIPADPIPLISYPVFWELLSLLTFSFVMLGIILISMLPWLFIPKFNRRSYQDIWSIATEAILYDGSHRAIAALCKIICKNIDVIIHYASQYDRHWNIQGSTHKSPYEMKKVKKKDIPVVATSVQLIEELLSHDVFCKFIAQRHLALVMHSIDLAERSKLWHSCGYFFFNNMFKWLFEDLESLLSQELKGSGTSYSQPLSNHAFKASGIISHYRIFQSYDARIDKLKPETVKKVCHGLEIALNEYFNKEQLTWHADAPTTALSVALKDLAGIVSSICVSLVGLKQEIWRNPYSEIFSEISLFFDHTLPNALPENEDNLAEDDKQINDRSLLKGIVDAIFDYLEGLSWLSDTKYARHQSTHVFWILWSNRQQTIGDKLRTALFEKIKKRINENKGSHYPPLIRLLLDVYGFKFRSIQADNPIGEYIQNEFYENIAKLALENEENAKYFLPSHWKWDLEKKTIQTDQGRQLFPLEPWEARQS
ncbi:MAG: hypothetical protein HYU97_09725 [Deltaproteobacteria bacterium]|nr:hypothetical protein [Deltaproteobacteria bacterium]